MSDETTDPWLAITTHELFYLLSLGEGSANDRSRARLGIPAKSGSPDMALAGAATLLVRGLARSVDEEVEPVDQAALAAWLLSTAHTWLEVGATVGGVADALLVLANDDAGAVLAPQALGIFRLVVIDPGQGPTDVALAFASSVLERNEGASISVRKITANGERSGAVNVQSGSWKMVKTIPEDASVGLTPVPIGCTRGEAFSLLEEVLSEVA